MPPSPRGRVSSSWPRGRVSSSSPRGPAPALVLMLAACAATISQAGAARAATPVRAPKATPSPALPGEAVVIPPFGTVTLYRATPHPSHVVLFASGDGGWNAGVVDMARALANRDALVIGFATPPYLRKLQEGTGSCTYPAGELETLSHAVQQRLGMPDYIRPVLVGYSSGATLAYATLAQSPAGTWSGAVGLGFCPDLDGARPPCKGSGPAAARGPGGKGWLVQPGRELTAPFIVLEGEDDRVCDIDQARAFVGAAAPARLVSLAGVGHGFSVPRHWQPQLEAALAELAVGDGGVAGAARVAGEAAPAPGRVATPGASAPASTPPPQEPDSGEAGAARDRPGAEPAARGPVLAPHAGALADVSDLPLVEIPPRGARGGLLAVVVSGDGGWAGFDKDLGEALAAHGYAVVGWDSLHYFWKAKTPEVAAKDLERVLAHYAAAWGTTRAVLAGYSFGADVLPFMVSRLPPGPRSSVAAVVLLGLSERADFQFHFTSWFGSSTKDSLPVLPELGKLRGTRVLCVKGSDEKDSRCDGLDPTLAQVLTLRGGHHLGGDVGAVAEAMDGLVANPPPAIEPR